MTTLSKLQQEVIEKFDNFFPDGLIPTDIENVKQFILNTIEEAYKSGREETRKEVIGEVNYAVRNSYREVQSPTGNFEVLDPEFLNEQLLSLTQKEKNK